MNKNNKKVTSKNSKKKTQTKPHREILLLLTETELMAIVNVERIYEDTHPDDPFRVIFYCKALDSFGLVYDLELQFYCETLEEKEKVLSDLKIDSIHLVKGEYSVFKKDCSIVIFDPEYMVLPPGVPEEDVREVLRVNSESS